MNGPIKRLAKYDNAIIETSPWLFLLLCGVVCLILLPFLGVPLVMALGGNTDSLGLCLLAGLWSPLPPLYYLYRYETHPWRDMGPNGKAILKMYDQLNDRFKSGLPADFKERTIEISINNGHLRDTKRSMQELLNEQALEEKMLAQPGRDLIASKSNDLQEQLDREVQLRRETRMELQ